jgi:hypothetical protein
MKHIKKFYLFLEAENLEGSDDISSIPNDTQMDNSTDVAEKSALAEVEKNLKDFQNRQQKMVNIFNDKKIITDSDLEKALLNGVYDNKKENKSRNRYLKDFESVLRSERRKKKLEESIAKDKDSIKSTNDDIYRLESEMKMDLSQKRIDDINVSLTKNRNRLKELKDNILKNEQILKRDIIVWQKKREDFKKDMKDEEERIKKLSSKI